MIEIKINVINAATFYEIHSPYGCALQCYHFGVINFPNREHMNIFIKELRENKSNIKFFDNTEKLSKTKDSEI